MYESKLAVVVCSTVILLADTVSVDYSDSDAEDSDLELPPCSVLLLTGPCGVGKTTSAYALAQDAGFKVQYYEIKLTKLSTTKRCCKFY